MNCTATGSSQETAADGEPCLVARLVQRIADLERRLFESELGDAPAESDWWQGLVSNVWQTLAPPAASKCAPAPVRRSQACSELTSQRHVPCCRAAEELTDLTAALDAALLSRKAALQVRPRAHSPPPPHYHVPARALVPCVERQSPNHHAASRRRQHPRATLQAFRGEQLEVRKARAQAAQYEEQLACLGVLGAQNDELRRVRAPGVRVGRSALLHHAASVRCMHFASAAAGPEGC